MHVVFIFPVSLNTYRRRNLEKLCILNIDFSDNFIPLKDSSRYTFHYRNSITITALSQASRARQRNRAVSGGCSISIMVKVNIMVNILYRELNFVQKKKLQNCKGMKNMDGIGKGQTSHIDPLQCIKAVVDQKPRGKTKLSLMLLLNDS